VGFSSPRRVHKETGVPIGLLLSTGMIKLKGTFALVGGRNGRLGRIRNA